MSDSDPSPSPARRATLVEVARLAGVSHQTVSRYLRQNGGLKPATVVKVQRAIEELHYRPNLLARSMRTRRSGRLAIVLPATTTFAPLRLLNAASAVAHEAGFVVETTSYVGGAATRAERVRELADSGQVDGILSLASLEDWSESVAASLLAAVVVVPEYDDDMHGLGELADGATVREILEYLASLGHRRFFHVAGSSLWPSARNRREVYLTSIAQLGLESFGVWDGDWSAQSGYDAVAALPDEGGPTAVVAANDIAAIGAIRGALDRGWRVPEDISVFGWDDLDGFGFTKPSLSTVSVNREAQGRNAMLRLIAAVRKEPAPPRSSDPLNRLVLRESTGPPPSAA